MPIIISEGERPQYQRPTPGTVQAVCFNVWDLGWQKKVFQGRTKARHGVRIGWELTELVSEGIYQGKRLTITKPYTASLFNRSALHRDLVAWRGRPFTQEERNAFDLETFIGQNCFLSLIAATGQDGKEYTNIAAVIPLAPGFQTIEPENRNFTPVWVSREIEGQLTEEEAREINEESVSHQEESPF